MNGTIPRIAAMMEGMPMGLLGVSACNESDNWRYYIAVASSQPIEKNLEEYIVHSSMWAIFFPSLKIVSITRRLNRKQSQYS